MKASESEREAQQWIIRVSCCISQIHCVCSLSDEDSNLATSPMPDMDSDSMICGPVDEEERWLDALEKGELDDNGELKKEVDESLLTARQVKCWKQRHASLHEVQ